MTTIFYATDIHGSDVCWKKFINAARFYGAEVLILGGDMTGKAIVPIVYQGGDRYRAVLLEQEFILRGEAEVEDIVRRIRSRGYYPYRTTPDQMAELQARPDLIDKIFVQEVLRTAEEWLAYADAKLAGTGVHCYVAPANDDMFEIDDLVRSARHVQLAEGQVVNIDDHHEMLSSGWSNITPWHTYREEDEDKLRLRYQAMLVQLRHPQNGVFNLHVPPYGSTLDEVPELTADLRPKHGGRSLVPVGSHAVREIIEQCQPLLGLFGHIHEARAAMRLGRTLCINPGSMYEQGRLFGAVVRLKPDRVENYVLTTG